MIALFIAVVAVVLGLVYKAPIQQLVQKAGGFSAKTTCSAIFLSGRKFDEYLHRNELSTLPPFLVSTEIDYDNKVVRSYFISKSVNNFLGVVAPTAVYLGPKSGCQLHQGDTIVVRDEPIETSATPQRTKQVSQCVDEILSRDFSEEGFHANQTRAVVVSHKGVIVGERYQDRMGIDRDTRLLGWSMTKSVHSAIVGAAIQAGMIHLNTPVKLSDLSESHRNQLLAMNGGVSLTFSDLLQMKDILLMEEKYGIFDDVSTMLYGSPDAGKFASSQGKKSVPSIVPSSEYSSSGNHNGTFGWYYSSGVSNILARELRDLFSSDEEYRAFPHSHIFSRIGANSFAIEMDSAGTLVASSFAYATARDWSLLGELFLRGGEWEGDQVLPAEFVKFVQQPHPHSGGHYGGHFWLNPARVSVADYNELPLDHPEKKKKAWMTQVLPKDAYAMNGYLGQTTLIIPSRDTVIVRLAFTPDPAEGQQPKWDPKVFYGGILDCLNVR